MKFTAYPRAIQEAHLKWVRVDTGCWRRQKNAQARHIRQLKDEFKLTWEAIEDLLSESKPTLYTLYRYGADKLKRSTISAVRKRDKYKCQNCGALTKLHTHHIGDATDHSLKNLVTLCAKCHKIAHKPNPL